MLHEIGLFPVQMSLFCPLEEERDLHHIDIGFLPYKWVSSLQMYVFCTLKGMCVFCTLTQISLTYIGLFRIWIGFFYIYIGLFDIDVGLMYIQIGLFYIQIGLFYIQIGLFYIQICLFYIDTSLM